MLACKLLYASYNEVGLLPHLNLNCRTSAAHSTFGTPPFAVRDAVRRLANATQVVRCRAAVAAQQAATHATKDANFRIAIVESARLAARKGVNWLGIVGEQRIGGPVAQ